MLALHKTLLIETGLLWKPSKDADICFIFF